MRYMGIVWRARHRRLASLVTAVVLGFVGVMPMMAASPAAAVTGCSFGNGPYWWASYGSSDLLDKRLVLAVDSPWGLGSKAYLWAYNYTPNEYRQKWCMDRVGTSRYLFRYAYNINLCMTANESLENGGRLTLQYCNASSTRQIWEQQVMDDQRRTPWENIYAYETYRFRNVAANRCLDVNNYRTDNGAPITLWDCHTGDNQRWY